MLLSGPVDSYLNPNHHFLLQIEKTHPADWRNPGRVKVLLQKDGKFAHPIITTRKWAITRMRSRLIS